MINGYCEICKQYDVNDHWVLRLSEDKIALEINGHKDCVDKLHSKVMKTKDLHKKNIDKLLKEINFTME